MLYMLQQPIQPHCSSKHFLLQGRQGSTGGTPGASHHQVPDDLGQLAAEQLKQLYASKHPSLVPVVQASLACMGFR